MGSDGIGYVLLFYPFCDRTSDSLIQIWEFFLAWSTIISRQGSATCYQITLVKNINSTHRVEGIPTQYGLSGAMAASRVDGERGRMPQ